MWGFLHGALLWRLQLFFFFLNEMIKDKGEGFDLSPPPPPPPSQQVLTKELASTVVQYLCWGGRRVVERAKLCSKRGFEGVKLCSNVVA